MPLGTLRIVNPVHLLSARDLARSARRALRPRAWSAGLLVTALASPVLAANERTVETTLCSSCSSEQARRLLDAVQAQALLDLDLMIDPDDGRAPAPPLVDRRRLILPERAESTEGAEGADEGLPFLPPTEIELSRSEAPAGGWNLHAVFHHVDPDRRQRLVETLNTSVNAVRDLPEPTVDLRNLTFEVFPLSYAQSDRTLGLLKALGYSTVEFQASDIQQSKWESIFDTIRQDQLRLPVVIKLLDSDKTSLLEPLPTQAPAAKPNNQQKVEARTAIPEIGGQFLYQTSTGEPLQRLLIAHDPAEPAQLQRLLDLLEQTIDVPARQLVIEAIVIEVNTERLGDLGFSFAFGEGEVGGSFQAVETGRQEPFQLTFNDLSDLDDFQITLSALVEDGDAEILSKPSVLVMDGRQARIQVGQQIPIVSSAATVGVIAQSVEYFPVGIVLNLRPRLNRDASDVTMQVETIVSAVTSNNLQVSNDSGDVFFAPTIDNRRVQTLVRVADNTPFIIGGLISTEERERISRVPGLSRIPILGALFRRKTDERVKTEVIVVITPHVVPLEEKNFSFVVPKESDRFDSFDHELFRNTYRVRQRDVFDLRFVRESDVLESLRDEIEEGARRFPPIRNQPPFEAVLDGHIPGEEILVHRMLWETIRSTGAASNIRDDRIILFERPDGADDLQLRFLNELLGRRTADANTLTLRFPDQVESPVPSRFAEATAPRLRPAVIDYERIEPINAQKRLKLANGLGATPGLAVAPTIHLGSRPASAPDPMEILRSVLVLKRVLDLNDSLPKEIDEFYVGRQIVYPSPDDLATAFHVVDARTAELFFEVQHYYPAFEAAFNRALASIRSELSSALDEREQNNDRP